MITQSKKNSSNIENPILGREKNIQRPNIDHLIKRIRVQRRKERNINILTTATVISGIAIISYLTL
jgi:hypothetical protein|tara:strand:- start:881 stop:1078 length:198 start_codon:yes stop_codon:yes gene_type:complete